MTASQYPRTRDHDSLVTVLLSGGVDSATALAELRSRNVEPEALFVDLGQPARVEELRSARAVAEHFDVTLRVVTIGGLRIGAGEIAGRNLLLVSAALAARAGVPGTVVVGVHAGTSYFDCGTDFLISAQRLIDGYHGGAVQLSAPFVSMTKADVGRLAAEHGAPLELTYSCERAAGPCQTCLSCRDREALVAAQA